MNSQQQFVLLIMALMTTPTSATIDEVIDSAAETSHAMDFAHDKKTVLVEMDMVYTKAQYEEMERLNSSDTVKRNGIRDVRKRWRKRTVPYIISNLFSESDVRQVNLAIDHWKKYTCLNFRRSSSRDRNRIAFQNGDGCYSNVGMIGNTQTVGLGPNCREKGVIIHEIGHAIGFYHEQTRADRNEYVTILEENIKPEMEYNFRLLTRAVLNDFNVPYDYMSIMHYGKKYFSKNGKPTIVTKDKSMQDVIGNRLGLSFRDIKQANLMYNCNSHCKSRITCPGEGFVGKDCRCWCPGTPVKRCGTGRSGGSGRKACTDSNAHCSGWAQHGYCRFPKYMPYMRRHCRKSCRVCSPTGCEDSRRECSYWAGEGYCRHRKYKRYMRRNCKKSCRLC